MKEKKLIPVGDAIYICIFASIFGIIICGLIINPTNIKTKNFDKGYKQGQIDALNGVQHYDKLISKDTIYIKINK